MTQQLEAFLGVPIEKVVKSGCETIYMVGWSLLIGAVIGFIIAVFLWMSRKDGLKRNDIVYFVLNSIINIVRSTPFIILMVTVMPLTKLIIGTRIGTKACLVPLILYISPYFARLIEGALLGVDPGIVEAAKSMGATTFQIITQFVFPEAFGSMVIGITTGTVGLIGATAMAGYIGGGGVGNLALTYGYQTFNTNLMIFTVIILIIFVQIVQTIGNKIAEKRRMHL
ncbi:MAG TPA: methionine ABC transporter permease [Oribacterium sp.]|nr:methionine ABC transporter permease [Oribacterium sp.]